jgi:antitoxin HicB
VELKRIGCPIFAAFFAAKVGILTFELNSFVLYHLWYNTPVSGNRNRKRFDHSGASFDSFLEEEGIREEVEAVAIKRVLAWQLEREMKRQQKTKQAMAKQLRTSRSQLDRLLDPRNASVTLDTMSRAARALGKRLIVRVADVKPKTA